ADTSTVVTGLFYGGGVEQLWIQFYGTFAVAIATLIVSMGLMYGVKATGTLRVSREGELEGLDIHEHGAAAYPEFVTAFANSIPVTSPTGPAPTSPTSPTRSSGGLVAAE